MCIWFQQTCSINIMCEWHCSLPSISYCRGAFRSAIPHPLSPQAVTLLPVHSIPAPVYQLLCYTTVLFEILYCKIKNILFFMFFKCAIYVKSIISPSVVAVRSPSRVLHGSSQPHGLQHASPACSSPSLEICPSSCPLNQWCHPTISSSITLFLCLQSFPASQSFPMSRLFTSESQSIGASASASVLPMSIQG